MTGTDFQRLDLQQKQIEQELQDSQAHLAAIIASAMDAIITIDEDQHILLFNRSAEQIFGYTSQEVIGASLDRLLPERFRVRHREYIRLFGEKGTTNRTMGRLGTLYGLRASGEEFPIEASISQINTVGGRLFTVILRDVTERVKAEEKLVESEQQLRATFEQAAVGIAHISPDGRWRQANQKLIEILSYDREELLSKTIEDLTHPQDLQVELDLQNQLIAGQITTYSIEKRFIRKDGSLVWANLTASLVRGPDGEPKYLVKVIEDITRRKEAEAALQKKTDEIKAMTQQLWQTAKLATMGELAASIAHELNNPLAILSLRIESLLASVPESAPERRELEVMEQEVDRMAYLVSNLLQFSRSTQRQISSLDLREEVDRTLDLIHNHLIHRQITVRRDYAPLLPMIQADRQQMRQLFLNLFTNASDAMPDGGELVIRITPIDAAPGLRVDIQDTGMGIHPADLSQVMEPFYTTKGEGKGTGLGLAICRRIVEEQKGSIRISSPGPGQGTLVQMVLPGYNDPRQNIIEE